ncbi:2-octaprenyl-3-methyl-6-methoxy-1,4-benzoquinol hydroxylase [Marinobacter segnicrescens]|uniref:2-octaprenyl-3-methyl-6-methoxy-1,4-benzoquinol hydroxylase n=1 Tax=Marinobacter segnicrescens TaxID=430453 RepID=A0A1I0FQN6_9GAMM|nr:FAD-dependent monooxygenase [Marinobacter segnicrescens]SET59652.1 2-octaprenyl-3-methyl-6-methoxy-1,4-benzoquinol hydroxylase [Marinobacter segnicrescens]
MTQTFDFIVVGAGMVGAAIANGLAAQGHQIALVDHGAAPQFSAEDDPDIRVSALSAGSERYLRELGAWDDILAMAATPYRRLAVWEAAEHPVARLMPVSPPRTTFSARDLKTSHLGHIVENRVTQKALWDRASRQPTVTFYSGAGIQSLADTGEQITATLDNGQTVTGRLLIGADGAGSRVRQLAGIGVSRDQYAQQALVASVRYRGTPADITWQAFQSSGPRAFLPLHSAGPAHPGESWASLVWYDDPAALSELKALNEQDFIARVRAGFPEELPDLTAVAARASFPIARQHAHTYFHDRVVLVGDAAHTINPLAGQGVNLGFQDARCLQALLDEARRQGQDPGNPQLLAQYEAERRPANRRMMLTMDAFYHLFSNRRTPLWAVRNLGLGLAQGLPFARNRVARYAMGIDEGLPLPARALLERLPSPWRAAG